MTDRITANLPSRDFDATEAFYTRLGFTRVHRDETWMILSLGPPDARLWVEFFAHPDLDPRESWFSACLRVRDMAAAFGAYLKVRAANEHCIARLLFSYP